MVGRAEQLLAFTIGPVDGFPFEMQDEWHLRESKIGTRQWVGQDLDRDRLGQFFRRTRDGVECFALDRGRFEPGHRVPLQQSEVIPLAVKGVEVAVHSANVVRCLHRRNVEFHGALV